VLGEGSLSRKSELRDAMTLAVVPVGVAVLFGLLLLPRAVVPEGVPVPIADSRELARTATADHELAERARREPLPGSVRALGSALRQFHAVEVRDDLRAVGDARTAVDDALPAALEAGDEPLLRLRAVQLEGFLEEARRFESTGVESPELVALAGGFVRSMRTEGWIEGHTLATGPGALAALFKQMWSSFIGLGARPAFAPSLDEERALYALYLARPHAPPRVRTILEARRRGARDARDCREVAEAESKAVARWTLEKIMQLGALDPAYPFAYARGVATFGAGDYVTSASSFREWLSAHPDGPLALRARSYLRAAALYARLD
jgi:hypothetical protein